MRRFRFAHVAESAGDTSHLIARAGMVTWDCIVCGSRNEDRSHCWECSQPRGNWICEECGRVNHTPDRRCSECGRERPEE